MNFITIVKTLIALLPSIVQAVATLEEALPEANLPSTCPKTNSRLMSFNEVSKEGIDCPHCGQKLIQNRWFTNEN